MADCEGDPLEPSSWYAAPDVCGSCIAWRSTTADQEAQVAGGICKLRPELRAVPANMRKCEIYKPRGQFTYSPSQVSSPKRRRNKVLKVVRMNEAGEIVTRPARQKPVSPSVETTRSSPVSTLPREVDLGESSNAVHIRRALTDVLRTELTSDAPPMHAKFEGGRVEINSREEDSHHYPAELLFSHLVHLQDSLSALESQIIRHSAKLGEKTSTDLVNYLKRAKGTMTTFNVMFQEKQDFFSSK